MHEAASQIRSSRTRHLAGASPSEQEPANASGVRLSVARNLKRTRKERGVTLATLASQSGVAKATISKLESGRGNPTVETLFSIADALGVSLGTLLAASPTPAVEVIRRGEGLRIAGTIEASLLGRVTGDNRVEILDMTFPPNRRREAGPHALGVSEHIFVTAGRLLVGPVDDLVELEAGDFVHFPADTHHVYAAVDGSAQAVAVMCYPSPLQSHP